METLVRRLDRVERENRSLKRAGVAIQAMIATVVLIEQALPKRRTIEAEKLVLKDTSGNPSQSVPPDSWSSVP